MLNIGLIGVGYWGKNLLRNINNHKDFKLVSVADRNSEITKETLMLQDSNIKLTNDENEILSDKSIDAVCIATPVSTHFSLSKKALINKKHVLVEKPLCSSSSECQELIDISKKNKCTLMVDHTYIFSGGVQEIKKQSRQMSFGDIKYISSTRVNLGLFQQDVNVLWDLAPHDFSILNYILGELPAYIEASGYSHFNTSVPDVADVMLHYASGKAASLKFSWMSPVKIRTMSVTGKNRMLIWDDLKLEETIKIYNSGVDQTFIKDSNQFAAEYRIGDIYSPRISSKEPLAQLIQHFYDVIIGKNSSIMSGEDGLNVVEMLEETQNAMDMSFARKKKIIM